MTDRAAIVTGGGTHIGRAISEVLTAHGAAVYVLGRREQVAETTAAELREQGWKCYAMRCDAADDDEVGACVDRVVDQQGGLDIMVCNAGAVVASQHFPSLVLAEYEETMRACVTTALVCAQHAARVMIERGRGGRVVLVGSIHGELGSDRRMYGAGFQRAGISYHAAKGAVVNLSRALACDLGEHAITVNCLSPGQMPFGDADADTVERFRSNSPLGRTGVPGDLKGAALLLSSPASSWLTGQNLVVDGGWSAW